MSKRYFFFVLAFLMVLLNACASTAVDEAEDVIVADTSNQVSNVSKFLDAKKWNELFPNRYHLSNLNDTVFKGIAKKDFYSYEAFLKAAKLFPLFLGDGNDSTQKRELAAFLANMSHETSGGWDDAPGGMYQWVCTIFRKKDSLNQ